jgi:hypothetical protein
VFDVDRDNTDAVVDDDDAMSPVTAGNGLLSPLQRLALHVHVKYCIEPIVMFVQPAAPD